MKNSARCQYSRAELNRRLIGNFSDNFCATKQWEKSDYFLNQTHNNKKNTRNIEKKQRRKLD